jgi:N-methylhydantoinase B/oxoprolinase/acetone carboxylase alpha subunit
MDELYAPTPSGWRGAIAELDGRGQAEDVVEAVEGDLAIRCTVEIDGDAIRIDFAGTARSTTATSTARSPYQVGLFLRCPLSHRAGRRRRAARLSRSP